MWSSNNYLPAAAMLYNSLPPASYYSQQLPDYSHRPLNYNYLVPVYLDSDYYYYNYDYYPDFTPAITPLLQPLYHYHVNYRPPTPSPFHLPSVPIRTHGFRDSPPHPAPAPYPLPLLHHRETSNSPPAPLQVLAHRKEKKKRKKRRSIGFRDAKTTTSRRGFNVRVPLQVPKLRNPSRVRFLAHKQRETRRCQGSAQPTSPCQKRSTKFPTRIPKRRRNNRDPSHFQASAPRKRKRHPPWIAQKEYSCNSLQVPNVPKRRTTRNPCHFRAPAPRKRKGLPPWIAPTEYSANSLQVSNVPKKSHKVRKWFPLRVSNQWRKRSHRNNACFRCKKQGHFAIRCPLNKIDTKSRLSSSVVFVGQDGLQYSPPSLLCWCGLRCSLTVKTRKKTSRKVYTCSLRRCKISRWEDEVKEDELISVPKCQCGAGFCRQCTESGGIDVGRKYFACPIKKGQGACTFFKLLNDESLTNSRHMDKSISPPRFTVDNCSDTFLANNVQKEIRSYVLDTVEYYPNQREITGNEEVELMEVELECEGNTSSKTPRKCNKRLRDGTSKFNSSFSNTVVEFINVPQSYSKGGDTEGIVHVRKGMLLRQTSIEENALAVHTTSHSCSYTSDLLQLREDWLTAAMNLNIELFKGWWGRLAYPPAPCLKLPEPKPFYCCVFPNFDPIFVPQIVDEVDCPSWNPQNPQKTLKGSLMFGAISDQFVRVARDLQNKLISLLKSSDFHEHDYMDQEANITFTALDKLQVQSQPFCKRVNELIRSACILHKAEGSLIPKDQSYNDSQDHYNSKKRKRDDLISDYDMAKADIETCKERLHSLSKETSLLKTMLFQGEARVSSCEAENKYHEARCAQISIDLIESEKRLQVSKEDLQLLQQKKEEYDAAEAAYKKARIELGIIT